MTLGVGVIGLGVGEQHARAFAGLADCKVVALCDRSEDKLARGGSLLPDACRYTVAEDLIDDPAVQVVSVASHDDDHAAQVLRALRARKHVFAEKPLCTTSGELFEIARAWREARGARLSTNTLLRRSPRFRWLKRAIERGELGTLYCIEGDYVYGRLHKLTEGWRGKVPGYSVMLGGGVHMIDLLLWLSGQRPVEVVAYGSNLGSQGTGFAGTDLALALLRFDSGLLAKIGANFASVSPHFHRLVVYGTRATFENPPPAISAEARLWRERDGGAPPKLIDEPYPGVGKGDLIPSFVDAILGRGSPDVPEEDAFACLATCLAIDQAIAQQRAVAIEYPPLEPQRS